MKYAHTHTHTHWKKMDRGLVNCGKAISHLTYLQHQKHTKFRTKYDKGFAISYPENYRRLLK
jgi:hypothetical protein